MTRPEDGRILAEDRWARVMCDYSAEPLWHRGGWPCGVDELPVDQALRDRLRRWQDWFEGRNPFAGQEGEPEDDFDIAAFSAEGLEIAEAVKMALPDWTVVYFDEAAYERAVNEGGACRGDPPRHRFEYEITSETAARSRGRRPQPASLVPARTSEDAGV